MEIMLVLVLIGITGALIVPQGRSERAQFANTMTTLLLALNAAQQRAEQVGMPVGVAVSEQGWQRMIYHLGDGPEGWQVEGEHAVKLPDSLSLALQLESQDITLPPAISPDATPQLWFYPGGEMSVFTLKLRQGRCEQALESNGYMSLTPREEDCDEQQAP